MTDIFDSKTRVFVAARMMSTRLPGKAALPFGEGTILSFLLSRLKVKFQPKSVVVCCTEDESDDQIMKIAEVAGVEAFRGNALDVAKRFLDAAKFYDVETFVRVTADNPFTDPWLIAQMYANHRYLGAEYSFNSTYPIGTRAEIISVPALERIYPKFVDPNSTEYLTYYLKRPDLLNVAEYFPGISFGTTISRPSITIDTLEEYLLAKSVAAVSGVISLRTREILSLFNASNSLRYVDESGPISLVTESYDCRMETGDRE